MKALFCSIVFTLGIACSPTLSAQTDSASAPVEVHEGLFGMLTYFGGKLVNELSDRLNLSEAPDSTQQKVPTRVVVRLGNVGFERTELRQQQSGG